MAIAAMGDGGGAESGVLGAKLKAMSSRRREEREGGGSPEKFLTTSTKWADAVSVLQGRTCGLKCTVNDVERDQSTVKIPLLRLEKAFQNFKVENERLDVWTFGHLKFERLNGFKSRV